MRHPAHDYSLPGGYFITFVTANRNRCLGTVNGADVVLSPAGRIVKETWLTLPDFFSNVTLDAFILMPDHVHCIMILVDPRVAGVDPDKAKDVPAVIQGFKGMSARRINREMNTGGQTFWQEGYIDRVIRNELELEKFRYYIETNPLRQSIDT